ncbi:thiolase family protein [Mycolicibacterium sp. XJ1819]
MTTAVHGVGMSRFGRQPDKDISQLAWEAVSRALDDAGPGEIDAVFVGAVLGPSGVGPRVARACGLAGVPVVTIETACASGTTAFYEAHEAIRLGRYRRVLALGVEKMSTAFDGPITPEQTDPEGRTGLALPALYALAASHYLDAGMATPEQLAAVAVKNRANGLRNEAARYGGSHTVAEVLASRMIADPLTFLQCCPTSDGAAAAVLGPLGEDSRHVPIRGIASATGEVWDHRSPHVWGFDLVAEVARSAYEKADLADVRDLDVVEVHDAFTIGEIVTIEALGLAAQGEGGKLAESGRTALGGELPVNPSGGLLSRGHPLGATGLAQVVEIVKQLRGEGGSRQVDGARLGLVETMGGGVSGIDGNACVVAVMGR